MKTALVTGAARGLGRAIAENLYRDHRVAFTWHRHAPTDAQASMPEALALQCDLTAPGSAQAAIDAVIRHFGQLDVLVNNAGIVAMSPLETPNIADNRAMFDLHVSAPAALLAAALPHLQRGAAIINISSGNAELPPMGASMYGASKAAQNLWTRGMAKELGPKGIRVNAVAPGAVNIPEAPRPAELTAKFEDLTALGALATPEDIAAAVRFLASDAARSITGEVLGVSGGYRL